MELQAKLAEDLKRAMRAKDTVTTETLRGIRAAILNREVEVGHDLSDDDILRIIRGLVKQRNDSMAQYAAGGRADLAECERQEREILEGYLPAAPDEATMQRAVAETVAALGATSVKDMGRVMKACGEALGPATDGKALSALVRKALE